MPSDTAETNEELKEMIVKLATSTSSAVKSSDNFNIHSNNCDKEEDENDEPKGDSVDDAADPVV